MSSSECHTRSEKHPLRRYSAKHHLGRDRRRGRTSWKIVFFFLSQLTQASCLGQRKPESRITLEFPFCAPPDHDGSSQQSVTTEHQRIVLDVLQGTAALTWHSAGSGTSTSARQRKLSCLYYQFWGNPCVRVRELMPAPTIKSVSSSRYHQVGIYVTPD